MGGRLLLDTNLLVLLLVGTASRRFIAVHKRTRAYTIDDFVLLETIVADAAVIITTPNVLSETSNLIRQFGRPHRDLVIDVFRNFVDATSEQYIQSTDAVRRSEFRYLGLTDVAILAAQEEDVTLITDDLDLYLASALAGRRVVNFTHEREQHAS